VSESNLVDMAKRIYTTLSPSKRAGEKSSKVDTSWHDQQVKEANDSFRKASHDPKLGSAKKATKKKAKRQTAAK
jgi:hypothetical protein